MYRTNNKLDPIVMAVGLEILYPKINIRLGQFLVTTASIVVSMLCYGNHVL